MLRASPRPLRTLFLVTGLAIVGGFGGLGGCQTPHSPGFAKVRPTQQEAVAMQAPAAARPLPEGTAEGTPEHLLHEYAGRDVAPDAEIRTWDLPTKAKRVIVELLILAARDDASRLNTIMTQQARWGAPDRREYDARSVSDDGRVFLDVLRQAASRFARKQNLTCPPIMPPAAQIYVKNGSEPMWCFYGSNDGLDILAFKLILEGGSAKVDYVGMYAERPTRMIPRPGAQPPPMTPMVRRVARTPNMPGLEGPLVDLNGLPGQPGGVILDANGQPVQPGPGGVILDANGQPLQPGQPGVAPGANQPGAAPGGTAGQAAGSIGTPGGSTGQQPGPGNTPAASTGSGAQPRTTGPMGSTSKPGTPSAAGTPGAPGTEGANDATGATGDGAGGRAPTATKRPATPRPAKPAADGGPAPATEPGPAAPAPIR